jgi:hypothetical protein
MEISVWGFPVLKYKFENPVKALEDILEYANEDRLSEMSDEWNAKCKSTAMSRDLGNMVHIQGELEKILKVVSDQFEIPLGKLSFKGCEHPECFGDYWVNQYTKGDQQDVHYHMNPEFGDPPLFSFTYFAKYDPEKDAKFYFYNPSPAPDLYKDFINSRPEFKTRKELDIREGEIIIFPSYMLHGVDEQLRDESRITLSGNIHG